jgi:hypothetical protein
MSDEDPNGQQSQGGYMVALPAYAPADMTITGMEVAMLPWQAPRVLVALAQTSDGEPAFSIAMEWPITWLRTVEPLPKFEHEALLLRRFSSDQALVTGRHAYGRLEPGADPPDATAITDGGSIGVESTALTAGDRRGAHGLFMNLRRRLQEHEPAAFANLAGHTVYVWFDSDGSPIGLPHRRSDEDAIRELMQALADYRPQTDQLNQTTMPQTMPDLGLEETDAGAKFYAVPIVNAAPGTMLFTLAGFELGLAHTSFVTARGAWDEVQRLVDKHDQPGVDMLVITAGGPDVRGMIFPGEGLLGSFIVSNPLGLPRPSEHIKRIVLHWWGSGEAWLLHPTVEQLFPGGYQGITPLHHPFVAPMPTDESAASE